MTGSEIFHPVIGLLASADPIEARPAAALGRVGALTPSLLARALSGKLVPQNLTDEPASALAERIRKEGPRIPRMARLKKEKHNP